MPQQTLFLADQKQPTASVLLDAERRRLRRRRRARRRSAWSRTPSPGLTPANVVDHRPGGRRCSARPTAASATRPPPKLATESSYSRQLESGAQQIVDQMLGAGAGPRLGQRPAQPRLADREDRSPTARTATPLTKTTEKENLKGSGAARPAPPAPPRTSRATPRGTIGGSATDYTHTKGDQTNGVDQTVDRHDEGRRHADQPVRRDRVRGARRRRRRAETATTPAPGRPDEGSARRREGRPGLPRHHAEGHHAPASTRFQTSVSTLPAAGLPAARAHAGYVPPSQPRRGARAAARSPPSSTSHLREGAAVGRRARPALPRPALAAPAPGAARQRRGTLDAHARRPRRSPSTTSRCRRGPSQGELEAANKKALQGRVEEIAGQRPSDVAQQLRGWLAEDS